jgi:hypothetical protein
MNTDDFERLQRVANDASLTATATLGKKITVVSAQKLSRTLNTRFGEVYDTLNQQQTKLACKAGCSFCCNLRVSAFGHELIGLYYFITTQMPKELARGVRQRVLENAQRIASMTESEHFTTNIQCALLVDGKCSAYPVRPAACAGYHSLSLASCEHSYHHPTDLTEARPYSEELAMFYRAIDDGLENGLEVLGLDTARVELHTGLAALMADPSLIQKWSKGRQIIARSRD